MYEFSNSVLMKARFSVLLAEAEIEILKTAHAEVEFLLDKHPERVLAMEEHLGKFYGALDVIEKLIPLCAVDKAEETEDLPLVDGEG